MSAIRVETDAMHAHDVFQLLPDNAVDKGSIIPSKSVLNPKRNANGLPNKWKAHLISRGDRQVPG
jgi:hypothetical protein